MVKYKIISLSKKVIRCQVQIVSLLAFTLIINLILYYSGIIKFQFILNEETVSQRVAIKDSTETIVIETSDDIKDSIHETPLTVTESIEEQKKQAIIYPDLLKCHNFYNYSNHSNYSLPAHDDLHGLNTVRGILIYYPADKNEYFEQEFKWLYRSWLEMQKHEPNRWRTDLVIFMNQSLLSNQTKTFEDLKCSSKNLRKTKSDKPMCTIIDYVAIKDRVLLNQTTTTTVSQSVERSYENLFKNVDIFNEKDSLLGINEFYLKLKDLKDYNYVDSILIAFDGYSYLKDNFDFLLRTDMDIFLTPLFGKWLPLKCNDFIVGGGGYSHDFNMKRLKKIAKNLNLEWSDIRNLGSTWFSTPSQFRLVSYYTLLSMVYISMEEFSETERQGKVGTILWPEWHYGVLLLYGQNLAMNHLISTKQINVVILENLIDYPSANEESVFSKVHIHVFHGEDLFSKFMFRLGKYDNYTANELDSFDKTKIKYYTLSLALESRRSTSQKMVEILNTVSSNKV